MGQKNLDNKVAIVTGAGGGLGRAIALRLAADGASVAVTALHEETVADTVHQIEDAGGTALSIVANAGSEEDMIATVAKTVDRFGRLDIIVNNAGVITQLPIVEMTLEEWNRIFQINVTGTFVGCREAAKQLILQGQGGRIINGSSIAGRKGLPFLSAYGSSKAAIIGMTQSLAAELAQYQITVNAYVPGNFTTTPMWDVIAAEYAQASGLPLETVREHFIADVPLARDGRPEEVASAVAYLASDEACFITGESIVIDGGVLRH